MEWTDQAIRGAGLDAPCLLTTDIEDIADAGKSLGWKAPFLRPAELASDTATTLDAVMHALDWWRSNEKSDPEYVMLLQVTSPFRDARILKKGVEILRNNTAANAIVGMRKIQHGTLFQMEDDGFAVPKEQPAVGCYIVVPNGALYLIRSQVLREQKTFFPTNTLPLLMDEESSVDIDTNFDWDIAEMIAEKKLKKDHT